MHIDKFWTFVAAINWNKNPNARKEATHHFEKFTEKEVSEINEHFYTLFDEISSVLKTHLNNPAAEHTVSDDEFSDLCSEIIGRGKTYYHEVLANPEIARVMIAKRDFKESFSYCFLK